MTVRLIFPRSRRRPVCAAVALMLVIVALLLVAGCIPQGFDNQTQTLPKEKYVGFRLPACTPKSVDPLTGSVGENPHPGSKG